MANPGGPSVDQFFSAQLEQKDATSHLPPPSVYQTTSAPTIPSRVSASTVRVARARPKLPFPNFAMLTLPQVRSGQPARSMCHWCAAGHTTSAFLPAAPLFARHNHTLIHPAKCKPRHTPLRPTSSLRASLDLPAFATALSPTLLHLSQSSRALSVAKAVAGPGINIFNFVMVVRIILSWYPQTDLAKAPWIYIAVPTEPLLRATRKVIPPVGGVDISPIVWFALMSFLHEILVGPQGLLVLLELK